MKSPLTGFIINFGLLILGSVMAFTGFLIQLAYHIGHHGDIATNSMVSGISYSGWSVIHKTTVILVSILMTFHIIMHWKWYKTVIRKNIVTKNKQVFALSIIFILSAFTGYTAWLIKLTGGEDITSKVFVEIHDKLTIILFVFLILHVSKRLKWFINVFKKLILNPSLHKEQEFQ